MKGEGNQQDYGMRIYDPRIGKFLSVDPLGYKMPDKSSYSFSNNNPIYFIDPDGAEPVPITSKFFIALANQLGIIGNKRVGEFYEKLVLASLQTTEPQILHNTVVNFPSPARAQMNGGLPAAVRPDGVTKRLGVEVGAGLDLWLAPAFYEAKVTSATITKKYRQGQITGMIDAVARQKRAPDEIPSLTLVTPVNANISDEIKKYADDMGVMLYHSVVAIDDETGEFQVSDRLLLNPKGAGLSFEFFRHAFDWDRFEDYKAVDPFDQKYRRNAPETTSDPDPATAED